MTILPHDPQYHNVLAGIPPTQPFVLTDGALLW